MGVYSFDVPGPGDGSGRSIQKIMGIIFVLYKRVSAFYLAAVYFYGNGFLYCRQGDLKDKTKKRENISGMAFAGRIFYPVGLCPDIF